MNAVVTDPVTMLYHELRSPLALVATAARCAAAESADEYVRSRCESIVRVADRMLRTAAQVIEVAGASQASEKTAYLPAELVESVVEDYRQMGVAVVLDSHGRGRPTRGVRQHLEALICSLIGNATDHGDQSVPIQVAVVSEGGVCRITVRNAVGSRRAHHGLGLGTYIGGQLAKYIGAELTAAEWESEYVVTVEFAVQA